MLRRLLGATASLGMHVCTSSYVCIFELIAKSAERYPLQRSLVGVSYYLNGQIYSKDAIHFSTVGILLLKANWYIARPRNTILPPVLKLYSNQYLSTTITTTAIALHKSIQIHIYSKLKTYHSFPAPYPTTTLEALLLLLLWYKFHFIYLNIREKRWGWWLSVSIYSDLYNIDTNISRTYSIIVLLLVLPHHDDTNILMLVSLHSSKKHIYISSNCLLTVPLLDFVLFFVVFFLEEAQ